MLLINWFKWENINLLFIPNFIFALYGGDGNVVLGLGQLASSKGGMSQTQAATISLQEHSLFTAAKPIRKYSTNMKTQVPLNDTHIAILGVVLRGVP